MKRPDLLAKANENPVEAVDDAIASPGLADILGPGLAVVFCGINPATRSAVAGMHFANPTNRFWRALHLAQFTPVQISPAQGPTILHHGYGLTTAVARPTRQASELTRSELAASATALLGKIETYQPRVLAFLGKPAYAAISSRKNIAWGRQDDRFGGALVWVLPNPSGLNRAFTLDKLVIAYSELRVALDADDEATGLLQAR